MTAAPATALSAMIAQGASAGREAEAPLKFVPPLDVVPEVDALVAAEVDDPAVEDAPVTVWPKPPLDVAEAEPGEVAEVDTELPLPLQDVTLKRCHRE